MSLVILYCWRECAAWATPLDNSCQRAMAAPNPASLALAAQVNAQYQTQAEVVANPAYAAAQNLFWEQRRKRGPPTPAISSTGLATPSGHEDATTGEAAATTPPQAQQAQQVSMFQPVVLDTEVAFQATAMSMGVDTSDTAATQAWMATPLTTRKDVLETIRHYHTAVVRPELYNMINQVEATLLRFDGRILRQSQELSWLASDNRAEQRRTSGLLVLLTGFPPTTTPQQRLYMVNWMLAQFDDLKKFLTERAHTISEDNLSMLNVLAADPTTPPAGPEKYSTITLINFKILGLKEGLYGPLWRHRRHSIVHQLHTVSQRGPHPHISCIPAIPAQAGDTTPRCASRPESAGCEEEPGGHPVEEFDHHVTTGGPRLRRAADRVCKALLPHGPGLLAGLHGAGHLVVQRPSGYSARVDDVR